MKVFELYFKNSKEYFQNFKNGLKIQKKKNKLKSLRKFKILV